MEAIGAAGAIFGLANSALTGLKSLGEFVALLQDGEIDLDTTQQRLVEHEFRLSELRNEYDSLPNGSITIEEKNLLDECIRDSHEEVKRYKKLLQKAGKTRSHRKGFQRVETAVRLYLHGEDFKKHRSLLQDRTMRLQEFNERSYRVRVNRSFQSIISSAAQDHAENMTAHARTASILQAVSGNFEKSLRESLVTSSALEAHVSGIVHNYDKQTRSLIQSLHTSTVHDLNESMRRNILPMIQGLLNESQISDRDLIRRNRRGSFSRREANIGLHANDNNVSQKDVAYMCNNGSHALYKTPLGLLRVFCSRANDRSQSLSTSKNGTAYWIRFDPYVYFSKSFVEWKLLLNFGRTGPPTSIWCNIGALCEDIEVIDALGLIPDNYQCSHEAGAAIKCVTHTQDCEFREWRTKLPDCRKLRRLLDERRFSHADFLRDHHGGIKKILSVFVWAHELCEVPYQRLLNKTTSTVAISCYCEANHLISKGHSDLVAADMTDCVIRKSKDDFEYLSRFYPAFYETLKFLLEIGCEPDYDWSGLMSDIACKTSHVMEMHPRYASTDYFRLHSAIQLVRSAAKCLVAPEWGVPGAFKYIPWQIGPTGAVSVWNSFQSLATHIGNLLPYEALSHELEDTVFDIGGADALNEELQYDRWLLVLMSHMQPRLRSVIAITTNNRRHVCPWDFSIERVCREIEAAPRHVKFQVAEYVVFHGNLKLLQFLIQKGFDPSPLLDAAARRGDSEILDFVLQSCLEQEKLLLWHDFMHHYSAKLRITQDPDFVTRLVDVLAFRARQASERFQSFDEVLIGPNNDSFLGHDITMRQLVLATPDELPEYISRITNRCILQYDEKKYFFRGGIRLYLLCGLYAQHKNVYQTDIVHTHEEHPVYEDLGRPLRAFHHVLKQLVSCSAFLWGLEHVPDDEPYSQEPGTEDYTPLMLAIHGGMIPAVKILVEAGAEISGCSPYGQSALELAERNLQSRHPRLCWGGFIRSTAESSVWERMPQSVSLSADREMLQILRDALLSQGKIVPDFNSPKPLPLLKFKTFWKVWERTEVFLHWLFSPKVCISTEDFSESLSYIAVLLTIAFLSITQLTWLKVNGGVAKKILRLLSRPIVLIPALMWIVQTVWQRCFSGSERNERISN